MNVIDVLMEEHLHVLMVMAATDGVAQATEIGAAYGTTARALLRVASPTRPG